MDPKIEIDVQQEESKNISSGEYDGAWLLEGVVVYCLALRSSSIYPRILEGGGLFFSSQCCHIPNIERVIECP